MFSQLFKDHGLFQHSQISTKFNFPLAARTFSTSSSSWLKLKFSQLSWCLCACVCVYAQVGVEEGCCQSNRLNRFRDSNQKKRHKSPRRSWFGLWVFRENPPQFALSLDRGFSSWKMPRRRRRTSSRDAAVYGPTSTLNVIVGRNFG